MVLSVLYFLKLVRLVLILIKCFIILESRIQLTRLEIIDAIALSVDIVILYFI
jgi:hypothetical protein